MPATIEIACCNVQSCLNAELAGAHRIELFENLPEGGCTPSLSTLKLARQLTNLPVYVMIRPRGGNFNFSEIEFQQMAIDIELCKQLNVDGIVFGILNSNHRVDKSRCEELLKLWGGSATFHRAIDESSSYYDDAKVVANIGFERLLTSGGESDVMKGLTSIKELKSTLGDSIKIMPGCGVTPENANSILKQTECTEIHATCKLPWNNTWVSDLDQIRKLATAVG